MGKGIVMNNWNKLRQPMEQDEGKYPVKQNTSLVGHSVTK
jgi:hypothetical protein